MELKNRKILIPGSLGLIGFEASLFFLKKGFFVLGVDNNFREKAFGIKTNYKKKLNFFEKNFKGKYFHYDFDIKEKKKLEELFKKNKFDLIIHTAAQTSHDWSAKDPKTDFEVNTIATFNLLELTKKYNPNSVFIFTSTNKVYGDLVNYLPFKEFDKRFDLPQTHEFYQGISETFSIDQSIHSPFGVSKASADLMVQEYGKYFGLKTGIFRLGVVSGTSQEGTFEQGFLSYMIKVLESNEVFTIIGYKGKQVRDIIHAYDVVCAFWEYYKNPKRGEVYNLGGGRNNAFSILELIERIYNLTGKKLKTKYQKKERKGDHKWWITDFSKFKKDYPNWKISKNFDDIILEIYKNDIFGKI